MIFSYKKKVDKFTTYTLLEPDYKEGEERITELCTIGGTTYVSVPDALTLPNQPSQVQATLVEVVLTANLKKQIAKASPHIMLIRKRVINKIREKYDFSDEIKMTRQKVAGETGADSDFNGYNTYVKQCIAWGSNQKAKLGL